MKARNLLLAFFISIIILATLTYGFLDWKTQQTTTETLDVFLGIDMAYDNVDEIKILLRCD